MRYKMTAVSAAMLGMLLASTLFFGSMKQDAFDIGDYSGVKIQEAEAAFAASQSNEDLLRLVQALCWRVRAAGDSGAREPLMRYGQVLLDRAKAEAIDLETAGKPETMLQVLQVIRELGVS